MNARLHGLYEITQKLAGEPDRHIADDFVSLVDIASGQINNGEFQAALSTLDAIRAIVEELRRVVPSTRQKLQQTILQMERQKYVYELEVVAFGHNPGLRHQKQMIEDRVRAAENIGEYIQEAMRISIASLDPEAISAA